MGGARKAERAAKVESLRERVEAGVYRVDPALVAEAILDRPHWGHKSVLDAEMVSAVSALRYEGLTLEEISSQTGYREETIMQALEVHHRPACLVAARR